MTQNILADKLMKRPIESDTTIKAAEIKEQDEYLFLFEESLWDGIYIYSIILLKEQFSSDFTQDGVEEVLIKYYPQFVTSQATYSAGDSYLYYNYKFRAE